MMVMMRKRMDDALMQSGENAELAALANVYPKHVQEVTVQHI